MSEKSMMLLPAWDPFKDFSTMTDIIGDLLSPSRALSAPRAWMPKVDVHETDKEYVLTVSVPGVKKEDVSVTLENGVLTISGERKTEKEEKDKNWLRRETTYGSFQRSFTVPSGVHPEEVKAALKDGLLTVALGKPAQAKARGVNVKVQ